MGKRLWMAALLAAAVVHGGAAAKDKDKEKDKVKDKGRVTVALVAPATTRLHAPAAITLAADAASSQSNHPVVAVKFFNGNTLIGTANSAPYAVNWTNVAPGKYAVNAVAVNDKGDQATSAPMELTVNAPPTATLTAPANNASYSAPGSITLTADATDSDGSIAKVELFNGSTLIGTATAAPYAVNWTNVAPGNYSITAKATDSDGASTTSAAVVINVNAAPTAAMTTPANNASYTAPASITLTANAADSDGSIAKVEFFNGSTLIGTATAAPYAVNWTNVAPGNYSITAKATDNQGASTTSATIAINVNAIPTAAITAPANNASYTAPATITLTANAADSDGSITQVEFFNGTTLIGTATAAPYAVQWTNVTPGNYSITAKATDNQGAITTSVPVAVNVNAVPTAAITAPANNASYTAPASITLTAEAADSDGSITQVEFFNGTTLIGTATAAPYAVQWTNVAAGNYSITAKATDNQGASTTSAAVAINVNGAPTVNLTAPADNALFIAPANIALTANATDNDGSISQVAFYHGTTLIGSTTTAPYSIDWTSVDAGSYSVTAIATDNQGTTTTSTPLQVTVINNTAPTISLNATPANATAPATIALDATAADSDGNITKVDFLNGNTVLATITTAPFSYQWTDVAMGSYTVTAAATDNLGATTTSAPVTVSVGSAQAQAYYIHSDHLNTPRVITDASSQVVWQWDNSDPFGANLPTARAGFEFNPRFPGQYFDRETGLHYNYFRDYDPAIGRYVQSDPIGLAGGINTYGYVEGNPISGVDPLGLFDPTNVKADIARALARSVAPAAAAAAADGPLPLGDAIAAGIVVGSVVYELCNSNDDRCAELLRQIQNIAGKLRTKIKQQQIDRWNLYALAYSTNPGGAIADKGTWLGHDAQITGLKVGLARKVAEAQAAGCQIPADVLELLATPNPTKPNK